MSGQPSAAERAYERLRSEILSGTLPVGPLDMRGLGDRLRMSVTPVREALARLGAERLIRREAHGYAITLLSPRRLENLYDLSDGLLERVLRNVARVRWADVSPLPAPRPAGYAEGLSSLVCEIANGQTNLELIAHVEDVTARLLPGRRCEPMVFPDAMEDLALLRSLWDKRDLEAVQVFLNAYHTTRMDRVDTLGRCLALQAGDP